MLEKTEADDVLDFINSLPDTKPVSGSGNSAGAKTTGGDKKGGKKDEELFDFLEELEQQSKTPTTKFEPKKNNGSVNNVEEKKLMSSTASTPRLGTPKLGGSTSGTNGIKKAEGVSNVAVAEPVTPPPQAQVQELRTESGNDELAIDPIASLSSWWSKEGSDTILSFWTTMASKAEKVGETTFQLASETTNQLNQKRQQYLLENHKVEIGNLILKFANGLIKENDELLDIHLTYDFTDDLDYLTSLVYDSFSLAMSQVEGDIAVNVGSNHNRNPESNADAMFFGKLIDGEKLCNANLESSMKEILKTNKKLKEEKAAHAAESESTEGGGEQDDFKISRSDIFVAIQPVTTRLEDKPPVKNDEEETNDEVIIDALNNESFSFIVMMRDISNSITIRSKTQAFPYKWFKWLNGNIGNEFEQLEGIDPREWVNDWIKDGLRLTFGVMAQEYVIKRMGF